MRLGFKVHAARQQKDPAIMKDLMEPTRVHVGSTHQAIAKQTVYEYTPMSQKKPQKMLPTRESQFRKKSILSMSVYLCPVLFEFHSMRGSVQLRSPSLKVILLLDMLGISGSYRDNGQENGNYYSIY